MKYNVFTNSLSKKLRMSKKLLLLSIAIIAFTFTSKSQNITCGSFCILNIDNIDTVGSNTLDVTIFNGDSVFVNYPIVVVTDALGDTIANIDNLYFFFGQLPGDTVAHTIPTSLDSIPAGFTGTIYLDDPTDSLAPCMFSYPMSCTVGINELASNISFNIYPNPATTIINIDFTEIKSAVATINIYDLTGKIVRSISTTERLSSIERGDLRSGIYFIQLVTAENVLTKKIVLE
jgi:hypothetical protein